MENRVCNLIDFLSVLFLTLFFTVSLWQDPDLAGSTQPKYLSLTQVMCHHRDLCMRKRKFWKRWAWAGHGRESCKSGWLVFVCVFCVASVVSVCPDFAVIPRCQIALIVTADLLTQPQKLRMHTHVCVCVCLDGKGSLRHWAEWKRRITWDSFPLGMSQRIYNYTHTHTQKHAASMVCVHQTEWWVIMNHHDDKDSTPL